MIFTHDNPNVFYSPERFTDTILSFTKGVSMPSRL